MCLTVCQPYTHEYITLWVIHHFPDPSSPSLLFPSSPLSPSSSPILPLSHPLPPLSLHSLFLLLPYPSPLSPSSSPILPLSLSLLLPYPSPLSPSSSPILPFSSLSRYSWMPSKCLLLQWDMSVLPWLYWRQLY